MKRVVTSVSIPYIVYKYYQDRDKKISKVLVEKYQSDVGNSLVFALKELQEAKDKVLQLEVKVLQLQRDCSTKDGVCSTIFEAFRKDRDINSPTSQDRHWLKCKLEDNNVEMSVEDFVRIYQNKKEDGK
jgi:hypothetical protein